MFADGVHSRPVFARGRGGNQRYRFGVSRSIGLDEASALKQRNLHHAEIVRRDDAIKENWFRLITNLLRMALDREAIKATPPCSGSAFTSSASRTPDNARTRSINVL